MAQRAGTAGMVLLLLLLRAQDLSAAVSAGERQALIDLYTSTNGASWVHKAGWLGGAGTECSWDGVFCDAGQTTVTALYLDSNNLAGTIPATIANLTNLEILYLESNQLTGTIPASIGSLSRLQQLWLNSNQLTGTIPTAIESLTSLQILYLFSNQLTGTIPTGIGNLTSLRYLHLNLNQLTGPIPATIGNLTGLKDLYLRGNQLTGTIPTTIGSLANLQNLSLASNQLTGTIPETIGNLTSLRYLKLASNGLTGLIPTSMTNLNGLVSGDLDIRHNGLYATDPSLINFLDSRQAGGDWQGTQTVAPAGLSASGVTQNSILIAWTPISYTADNGYYEVLKGTTSGGPYSSAGTTANKSTVSLTVAGLAPSTPYYFVVRTVTLPHSNNQSSLTSEYSSEVAATPFVCSYALNPAGTSASVAGTTGQSFQVQTAAGCGWTAVSNAAWITVTAGSSGTGTGTVTFSVAANSGPSRSGSITVGSQTFTVSQEGACSYSLVPAFFSAGAGGASGQTFQVQTAAGCSWTAVSNAAWITVSAPASGTGTGTVTFNVATNSGPSRSGSITAGGQTFSIQQGDGCSYSLAPSQAEVLAAGGAGLTFSVLSAAGCLWTAQSNSSWISVTAGATGNGTGAVVYSTEPNQGPARSGSITAGGRVFAVSQGAFACPILEILPVTLAPATVNMDYLQSLSVASGVQGLEWEATDLPDWLSLARSTGILEGKPRSVSSSSFTVSVRDSRECSGSRNYLLEVLAAPCPTLALAPGALPAGRTGEPYSVTVSASGGAEPYQYLISGPPWMRVNALTGALSGTPSSSGTFEVSVTVRDANGCQGSKTYNLVVAPCSTPATPSFTSTPGGNVPAGTPFTVSWTQILGSAPGVGSYEVAISRNAGCSSPQLVTTTQPWVVVPTNPAETTTYCLAVTAIRTGGCRSVQSQPALVQVVSLPPRYGVVRQPTVSTALVGQPPPDDVTLTLRNMGDTAGQLNLQGVPGFFSPLPDHFSRVGPGEDVTVKIQFAPEVNSRPGLVSGSLTATWGGSRAHWSAGDLAIPISLSVLASPAGGAEGVRLSFVGTDEFHFRHRGPGNPEPMEIQIVNTGTRHARVAPLIGPGGAWLRVSGDFVEPLGPGETRQYRLEVHRELRSSADTPPIATNIAFLNLDGRPEDSAQGRVFDEEPPVVESGAVRPDLGETEYSVIIGSVVRAEGIGARFVSDGWIRNRSAAPVQADLYFTPEGSDGLRDPSVRRVRISVEPFATFPLADLVQSLFGLENVSGQVEVRSSQLAQLSIRSTADAIATQGLQIARYGSEIPVVVSRQGIRRKPGPGRMFALLPGLRDSTSGQRANVILAETSGKPATARLRLFDRDGKLVGEKEIEVRSHSKSQVNSSDGALFPAGARFDGGSVEVEVIGGTGTIVAFTTVIDNSSGSFATRAGQVFDIDESGARRTVFVSEPAYLPAATRSEALNNSFYTSRLILVNLAKEPVSLTLTFLSDGGSPPVSRVVTIPRRAEGARALVFENVLEEVFEISENASGTIRFDGDRGSVCIASETSTPIDRADPARGRSLSAVNPQPGKSASAEYGVFSSFSEEVIGSAESGSARVAVTHPAIEEGLAFRTNLILAELAGRSAEVKVRLVTSSAGGATLGEKTYSLRPYQRLQRNKVIREILGIPSDAPSAQFKDVSVEVEALRGQGRVLVMVTKIDNNPWSKRADIFTLGSPVGGSPVSEGN